ncbi:cytosolic protein [Leptospira kanakyensis]|uniref:Cytosolic protein n=1 Tax=Leptospira kanakyensis TaxID=2484968 RepID=A0A6N4Q5M0_9LEPT|nr:PmeII family type II restriction endonuclease [Leptospira kanakyensis]TGK47639.1 cytosolic protein [Leptospira kanakyensis]TGK63358.1 cytosolic protein [Leptospira kanakyensis]TGK66963.1 cytosolic protein [Leptospira kanakyensis]
MNQTLLNLVLDYVSNNIGTFHKKRIQSLDTLKLDKVLRRKNPYLFKAKYQLTSEQIIKSLIDAHISSAEEGIFGDWLEELAIYVNAQVYGGKKSGITGIDLEFDLDQIRYLVSIKSGPNWGNSSQIKKMESDFKTAAKTLRTSNSGLIVKAINGCCYGRDNKPDKGDYLKLCGQRFWEFISGEEELYSELIEPLGHTAKTNDDLYQEAYAKMINKFTIEFGKDFCKADGAIDWEKLVHFNSAK